MSDRVIVYSGAIPLETDILRTNKYQMMGLAKLAASIFGTSSVINGLSCGPTSPASLSVNVSPGEMYSLANVDSTAYSSLSADTTHSVLKQAISLDTTTLTLTPPTTAGYSVNYLVQFAFQETDTDLATLAYYNASNPSQAWSGPSNSGVAQYTTRSCNIAISLKQGVAASTGSQSTPAADVGYVAGWVVTVANGQTAITSSNISPAANAPFLQSSGVVKAIQNNSMCFAADTGAANVYTAQYFPPITNLVDGMELSFRALNANTASSTFSPNGLTAYPITTHLNQALTGGEIVSGGIVTVKYSSTLQSWIIHGSTGSSAATTGRLISVQRFVSAGAFTYTPTPGTKKIIVEIVGGGGPGAGVSSTATGFSAAGGGGGSGAYVKASFDVVPTTVTGSIGAAGAANTGVGTNGGASNFGTYISAPGGYSGSTRNLNSFPVMGPFGGGGLPPSISLTTGMTVIVSSSGSAGGYGLVTYLGGDALGGSGGNSLIGCGGPGVGTQNTGSSGSGYGSGGGGACISSGGISTSYTGGNGAVGACFVWEYA